MLKSLFMLMTSFSILPFAMATFGPIQKEVRIAELKKQILDISKQASGKVKYDNEDNDPKVRVQLDILIDELVKIAPVKSQAEKLNRVVGVWKSVWSDLNFFGEAPLADSVYQVVFPDNYYYNLSNYDSPTAGHYAGIIKGVFTVQEPALKIKFVKFSKYSKPFLVGSDLATLAMRAELGEYDEQIEQSPGLGFESSFEQVYVDEQIRIGLGRNFDGFNTLFILERVTVVN